MIAFIGGGNMAEALIKGIRATGAKGSVDIVVSEPLPERRKYLEEAYGARTTGANAEAAEQADIIVIAVKPQVIDSVLADISDAFKGQGKKQKMAVSIAAGVRLSYLTGRLGTENVVRAMPNTPALIGAGMTVLSLCECIPDAEFVRVKDIFMSVGRVLVLPEKYMDAVTALSGSGPAFFALFVEGLIEGAVKEGLSADTAKELALQTAAGTLMMIEEGMETGRLIKMVTSPGGTTQAGLSVLENKGFKAILYDTIKAATKRAKELGKS